MASHNQTDATVTDALDGHIKDLTPIIALTRRMLEAVLSNHLADLARLVVERDALLRDIDFQKDGMDAVQLNEILSLNEEMRKPLEVRREELVRELNIEGSDGSRDGGARPKSLREYT